MSDDQLPARLRQSAGDRANTALQTLTSLVDVAAPGTGSFFGQLIGAVIPNQRAERMTHFIADLGRRLRDTSAGLSELADRQEQVEARLQELLDDLTDEQVALFEDGANQAVRAVSAERIDQIAAVVAHGMTEPAEASDDRRLLELISQLSEDEIVFLLSYVSKFMFDDDWRRLHAKVLEPVSPHMQSPEADFDRSAMRDLRKAKLLSFGVLVERVKPGFRNPRVEPTPLGRLVLRRLGLIDFKDG